jgi:hypothetical protein
MFGTLAAYISAVSFKCEELVGLGD